MPLAHLISRAEVIALITDPFHSQIAAASVLASFVFSLGLFTLGLATFCFLRPRYGLVYAPREWSGNATARPPPIGRGLFAWLPPVWTGRDLDLVEQIGLDSVVLIRFLRMCRDILLVLSVIGCASILPTLLTGRHPGSGFSTAAILMRLTPLYTLGKRYWTFVCIAYIFDAVICAFIWKNNRAMQKLRRAYLDGAEYRGSLHARTLMVRNLPDRVQCDQDLVEIVSRSIGSGMPLLGSLGRDLGNLPQLLREYEREVCSLEKLLGPVWTSKESTAKSMRVQKKRRLRHPVFEPQDVRRAEMHRDKILRLKETISAQRRRPLDLKATSFGFVTCENVEAANTIANAFEAHKPRKMLVAMSPKLMDIIWDNLSMSMREHKQRILWTSTAIVFLTGLYTISNVFIAVFLSNLSNLGLIWPEFQGNLRRHRAGWAIIQGVLAPLVQTSLYMVLPIIFRHLVQSSGDFTKSSRERRLAGKLYGFFVFNNMLVFSIFATLWTYFTAMANTWGNQPHTNATSSGTGNQVLSGLVDSLCFASSYWISWLLQRNVSSIVDLLQLWPLLYNTTKRRYFNLTTVQLRLLAEPKPFGYADYYNSYLFTVSVSLCFGIIQPLILPAAAFYFTCEVWFKSYMLQYVVSTKHESGGMSWDMLVNRLLFASCLANMVTALIVAAQGITNAVDANEDSRLAMLCVMAPLPTFLLAFRWYCSRRNGTDIEPQPTMPTSQPEEHRRFEHPALWKALREPE